MERYGNFDENKLFNEIGLNNNIDKKRNIRDNSPSKFDSRMVENDMLNQKDDLNFFVNENFPSQFNQMKSGGNDSRGKENVDPTMYSPSIRGREILSMDIDMGDGNKGVLVVHEHDIPKDVAKEFCVQHGLDKEAEENLTQHILS
jgi:hypothetical protein